ncbi:MAG: ribonuclease J [Bacilli bacterium]|nr:ribonuclease J [Bacilli bacterium]
MSKIRFFGLGGLGENGKNMFVCEVNDELFVLDAGLKYPSFDLYGVDTVIPDITYLIEHQKRIKGLFITHGHEDHLGAAVEVIKRLNVPVYGTNFTISILEDMLQTENLKASDFSLHRVSEKDVLNYRKVNVHFYNVSHSIPETVNIAIQTEDGAIVYAPDFTFDVNSDPRYQTSFTKLFDIAKEGVLALCAESLGTTNIDRTTRDEAMKHAISDVFQTSKRVIFSTFSSDLDRIQKIINIGITNHRRIAIIGRKAQKIVNIAMNLGYLKIPADKLVNLKFIDDTHKNDEADLCVIVTGTRHEPFYMLQRMARGQDRLITINSKDSVVIVTPPVPGTERMAAKTIDILYKSNAKVVEIKKEMLKSTHADHDELKMLYHILNPKYIVPIIGEYRHQYLHKNVALEAGYPENRIILLENGEVATFEAGHYKASKDKVQVGDVLIDGSIVGDINEIVLKDREQMSEDGIVVISIMLNPERKKLLSTPSVVSKGLIISESLEIVIDKLETITQDIVEAYLKRRYYDASLLKRELQEQIGKELYHLTKKNPIIMSAIVEVAS